MTDEDLNLTIGAIFDPDDDAMVRQMVALIDKLGTATDAKAKERATKSAKAEYAAKAKAANKANQDLNRQLLAAQKAQAAAQKKADQQEIIALRHILKLKQTAYDDATKKQRSAQRKSEFDYLAEQKSQQKIRLANEAASLREGSALNRQAQRRELEAIKTAGRSQYVAEQGAEARRTARTKAFLRSLSTTYSGGLRAGQSVLTSVLRRREQTHQESERRITNQTRQGITQQTSVIRQQLDAQNGTYTRSAQKRLATIERAQANETKVITRGAVKQAEAQAKIQAQLSGGVLGAAGGNKLGAGGLLGILAGAGAGRYTYDVLADFQSIQTTFRGIFEEVNGNAPRTEAFLDDLRDFAKKTPFTLRSLADYSQKFFANGLVDPKAADAVAQLTDKLLKLADAGAATGKTTDQINGAVLGLTQISASGRLSLEDLRQVTEGIGLRLPDVAAELGLTTGELFSSLEKGKVNAVDGLDAIFRAMTKIPGAAGAAARQSGNLRGAFSNLQDVIDSLIVKYLSPLGTMLAKNVSAFAEFLGKLSEGKGIYKIVRDGLTGIAIGLGLIIAAKGAVQVLGLLNGVLRLLAANPGIVALVTLSAAAGILYRNVPGIRSFFESLVKGTKDWYRVGYQLKEPITGLSEIVALQTSFGVAARVITDGLSDIGSGVKTLVTGGGGKALGEALGDVRKELGTKLTPSKTILSDWYKDATAELKQRLDAGRLNVGSFLISALGLGGSNNGIVSKLLRKAVGGILTDAFAGATAGGFQGLLLRSLLPDSTSGASQMGEQLRETVKGAIKYVKASGVNVGGFFSGLFTGNLDLDNEGNALGAQLRYVIDNGLAVLSKKKGPIVVWLKEQGAVIGDFFTTFVLPKLIEFPRILGRFLSRTLFSEGFLRAVTIAGAALAGLAVVIAGQFVRGFLEGLWQRRGDIATVINDILKFAIGAVVGSGNPFLILGAGLLAIFAGTKIYGAIDALKQRFHLAAFAMTHDTAETRKEMVKLRQETAKFKGPGAGFANFGRSAQGKIDGVSNAFHRLAGAPETVSRKLDEAGRRVQAFGDKMLGTTGLTVDAYGKLRNASGQYAKSTKTDLGGISRFVGETAVRSGQAIQRIPIAAKRAFGQVRDSVKSTYNDIKTAVTTDSNGQRIQFNKTAAAAEVAFAAIGGYAIGAAQDTQTAAIGAASALGGIATAFASPGGAVLGPLTILSTGVGFIFGQMKKKSDEAKALAAATAAKTKAITESIRSAAAGSFSETGDSGVTGVIAAQSAIIEQETKKGSDAYKAFVGGFQGDTDKLLLAAATGKKGVKDYTKSLTSDAIAKALAGDADTLKAFSKEARPAANEINNILRFLAQKRNNRTEGLSNEIERITLGLTDGTVTRKDFIRDLKAVGFTQKDATTAYKEYADLLTKNIGSSSGAIWLNKLPGLLESERRKQQEVNEIQAETDRRLEGFAPIAERFASAYGRIKESLDKAKEAYLGWIDASTGKQQTRNAAILDLFGAARDNAAPGAEGETAIEAQARKSQNLIDAQKTVAGQIAVLAKQSNGDLATLQGKLGAFFDELRNSPGVDQSTKDFLTFLQGSIPPDLLLSALGSQEPIESIRGVQTAYGDMLTEIENKPLKLKLEKARSFDETKLLVAQQIGDLAKSDPTIRAFMGTGDTYQENLSKILEDANFIIGLNPTLTVSMALDYQNFAQGLRDLQKATGVLLGPDGRQIDPKTGKPVRSALGRVATHPMLSTLAEEGPEVVLPLTKPQRMRELLGHPLVAAAIDRVAPAEVSMPTADPFSPAGAAPSDESLHVTQHIYETQSPRLTALETVRAQRAAKFRSGKTLSRRRPVLAGAPS